MHDGDVYMASQRSERSCACPYCSNIPWYVGCAFERNREAGILKSYENLQLYVGCAFERNRDTGIVKNRRRHPSTSTCERFNATSTSPVPANPSNLLGPRKEDEPGGIVGLTERQLGA